MQIQKTANDRFTPMEGRDRLRSSSEESGHEGDTSMIDRVGVLTAARAEALFTSSLSVSSDPSRAEVTAAIRYAVRTYGGTRGCAGEVAAAYGDYPDTAVLRTRWARRVIEATYPPSGAVTVPTVDGVHGKARTDRAEACRRRGGRGRGLLRVADLSAGVGAPDGRRRAGVAK